MIKFGLHTVYKGVILKLVPFGNEFKLIYFGSNCPFEYFDKKTDNIYSYVISSDNVSNAFFIITKCLFNNFEFDLENLEGLVARIVTDDIKACKELNLSIRDRGVYQKEIDITNLEKIWEERKPSDLGFPYPKDLPEIEEIKINPEI